MSDAETRLEDRGVTLLRSQLAELARLRKLLAAPEDPIHLNDACALGPFLDETDRIVASLEARQAYLDQLRRLVGTGGSDAVRSAEFRRLWQIMDDEMDRLRSGIGQFARVLTARQVAIATELEGLGDADRRRYPSGAQPLARMADTVG